MSKVAALGADDIPKARGVTLTDAPYLYDDDTPDGSRDQPRHQRQKLIVLCDGTWKSEQTGGVLTNVALLARCIKPIDHNGVRQVTDYQPGLGTGTTLLGNWREGMTGIGLYEAVREAYCFIARNYYDNRDEIHLAGFSRGAFTVRATAQFIHEAGLLTKHGLVHVLELFEVWKDQCNEPTKLASFKAFKDRLNAENLLQHNILINTCAVWDTVSSLGFPWPGFLPQPAPQQLKFVNSKPSPNVRFNYQALSLQERRRHFHPIVMRSTPPSGTHVEQCWFLGYHGDIGGGRKDNALSVFPLIWIMSKLTPFLDIDVTTIWPINRQRIEVLIKSIPPLGPSDTEVAAASIAKNTSIRLQDSYRLQDANFRINAFIGSLHFIELLGLSFGGERNARGFKQNIKDSMTFAFKSGGSWSRMPCRDLYNNEGPYQLGPQKGETTQETIHLSVNALINGGAIVYDKPPLNGAEYKRNYHAIYASDQAPSTWVFQDKETWWKPWKFEKETWWKVWQYKRKRPSRSVQEGFPNYDEYCLLAYWICHELSTLDQVDATDLVLKLPFLDEFESFVGVVLANDGHMF